MSVQVKVLGPGCRNCITLEANVKEAVQQLGIDAEVEKITDVGAIVAHGILRTPGLIVNGEIKASGRVPSVNELKDMIKG